MALYKFCIIIIIIIITCITSCNFISHTICNSKHEKYSFLSCH